jgi:hypothetical protein
MILIDLIPPGLTFQALVGPVQGTRAQPPALSGAGQARPWAIETIGWCGGWSSQQTPSSFRAIASGSMRRAHLHRLRHRPGTPLGFAALTL